MAEPIPIERRREVFAALVAVQDTGLDVTASRKEVAAQFGLTAKTIEKIEMIEKIENEGLEAQWPPLDA
jgi:hypothetical protein